MDSQRLDELLKQYREAPLPESPGNLSPNVWRKIRQCQDVPVQSVFDANDFLAWFRGRMSTLIAPALAVTLLVSVSWTALGSQPTSRSSSQQALGLQVFSHQALSLARMIQTP